MRLPALAVALVMLSTATGHVTPDTIVMQTDADAPVWDALRATGTDQATWATLLTTDADENGRTDFLDLSARLAGPGTEAELLVYAPAEARDALARLPGAERFDGLGAVFLTWPVHDTDSLLDLGATLVVWEPRAHVGSTNPASGNPAGMPQNRIHQAGTAWGSYTGDGVTIAVLDTGADTGHQSLSGGKVVAWKDCFSSATSPYDDHSHGTHVASIAAGDDGTDFRGLAYGADLAIAKILDSRGSGSLAHFRCGVNFVRNSGSPVADVASMSAGLAVPPLGVTTLNGGEFDLFGWDREAERITAADVPFAIAAGNWIGTGIDFLALDETLRVGVNGVNQVSSPGFSRHVVTVGAVDEFRAAATFTALGPGPFGAVKPDIAAQGVNTWGALRLTTDRYAQWDGTSMATPLVAGAMALLKEKDPTEFQWAYGDAITDGAGPTCLWGGSWSCVIGQLRDPNYVTGHGLLHADDALAYI